VRTFLHGIALGMKLYVLPVNFIYRTATLRKYGKTIARMNKQIFVEWVFFLVK